MSKHGSPDRSIEGCRDGYASEDTQMSLDTRADTGALGALGRAAITQARRPQGAALIAVLLLTLVLSAIGLMAMQNTFHSMNLAGNFRLRRQAMEASNAATVFVATRVGDRPNKYLGDLNASTATAYGQSTRRNDIRSGGATLFDKAAFGGISGGGGLFEDPAIPESKSFESDDSVGTSDFSVIIRDRVQGPPSPGMPEGCTAKKLFVASRATYDNTIENTAGTQDESNWDNPVRAGSGMVGMLGWVQGYDPGCYGASQ